MENQFELIECYLDDTLDVSGKKQVENLIATNKAFKAEYHLRRDVNNAIMEEDIISLRNTLNGIFHSTITETKQKKSGNIRKLLREKWYMAAASIAILILAGTFLLQNTGSSNQDKLFSSFYTLESALMTRSSEVRDNGDLSVALQDFESQDFDAVISRLSGYTDNMTAQFYMGLSYIEINQTEKALKSFNTIIDHKNNLYVEQAEWLQALCLLKIGDKSSAKESFASIKNSASIYKKKASQILKKIK